MNTEDIRPNRIQHSIAVVLIVGWIVGLSLFAYHSREEDSVQTVFGKTDVADFKAKLDSVQSGADKEFGAIARNPDWLRGSQIEAIEVARRDLSVSLQGLKFEIDAMKQRQETMFASMKESTDRVYDLFKWLVGGVGLSTIALALSSLVKSK